MIVFFNPECLGDCSYYSQTVIIMINHDTLIIIFIFLRAMQNYICQSKCGLEWMWCSMVFLSLCSKDDKFAAIKGCSQVNLNLSVINWNDLIEILSLTLLTCLSNSIHFYILMWANQLDVCLLGAAIASEMDCGQHMSTILVLELHFFQRQWSVTGMLCSHLTNSCGL